MIFSKTKSRCRKIQRKPQIITMESQVSVEKRADFIYCF